MCDVSQHMEVGRPQAYVSFTGGAASMWRSIRGRRPWMTSPSGKSFVSAEPWPCLFSAQNCGMGPSRRPCLGCTFPDGPSRCCCLCGLLVAEPSGSELDWATSSWQSSSALPRHACCPLCHPPGSRIPGTCCCDSPRQPPAQVHSRVSVCAAAPLDT